MSNEMITQLPTVSGAALSDIIYAVQGYVSPSSPGLSVQETLQQILNLLQSNIVKSVAGNPNGQVAGNIYGLCWDTVDNMLWVCTNSGTNLTAVWQKSMFLTAGTGITILQSGNTIQISVSGSGVTWNDVITASVAMVSNSAYVAHDPSSLVTLALPTVSSFGDTLYIVGQSSGGFLISQAAGQSIQIGSSSSTIGVGGSVASTNRYDALALVCITPNLLWQASWAPQGILTIV